MILKEIIDMTQKKNHSVFSELRYYSDDRYWYHSYLKYKHTKLRFDIGNTQCLYKYGSIIYNRGDGQRYMAGRWPASAILSDLA